MDQDDSVAFGFCFVAFCAGVIRHIRHGRMRCDQYGAEHHIMNDTAVRSRVEAAIAAAPEAILVRRGANRPW